jgi:transposase
MAHLSWSSPSPACHHVSSRPHSRYTRVIQDLPIADQPVSLLLISRKWFCDSPVCPDKVFTERYEWLSPHGRRTLCAEHTLRQIAFSTSFLSAQKVAQSVHLPVSHDTLLTIIRKEGVPKVIAFGTPSFITLYPTIETVSLVRILKNLFIKL